MNIPKRSEVPVALTWDLSRIFKTDTAWEEEFEAVKTAMAALPALKEQLTASATELLSGISQILDVRRRVEKLYVYASHASDVDTGNTHYLAYTSRAQSLAKWR